MKTLFFSLIALSAFTGCAPYSLPHSYERIHRNVVYAERNGPHGRRLHMDIYVPKTQKPAPVVVWIFGGSWRVGFKGYHVNLRDLTKYGIALAAIEYRLSGEAIYPAQLEDCQSALAWLEKNGGKYHIDPNNIGVSGESAGGHLAALLGTIEGKSKLRGVAALYPPTDLVSLGWRYSAPEKYSQIENLLGGEIENKLALAAQASPINHVSSDSPPFLLIHGGEDQLVPVEQSEKLLAKLHRAGVKANLIVVPGKGHWFLLDNPEIEKVVEFFKENFKG